MGKFIAIGFLLITGFMAVLVFEPQWPWRYDDETLRRVQIAKVCLAVLPSEQSIGLKSNIDKTGTLSFDLGGGRKAQGSDQTEIVARVLDCVEKAYTAERAENTFINRKPLPLGLVVQQFKGGEPEIYLERPQSDSDEVILNNVRFDPSAGVKSDVLKVWCAQNATCVDCKPASTDPEFSNAMVVSVSLRDGASLLKERMWGEWSNAKDLWELVDSTGTRFIYSCTEKQ